MDWQPHRLQAWLGEQLGVYDPITVLPMEGGFSNENYALDCGPRRWLLRKTPVLSSHHAAHNVLREYRVLEALQGTRVRVPKIVARCEDRAVLGTQFFIMDRINGERVDRQLPDLYGLSPDSRQVLGGEMIDVLVALHQLDWQALGLNDLGYPVGFLERQIERWSAQYLAVINRYGDLPLDLAAVRPLTDWLRKHRPLTQKTVLLHGDFHLANLLFSRQPPVRALALVDWELTTIGDPLLDLASALLGWFYPVDDQRVASLPTRQQLAQRYAAATAIDLGSLDYYLVLAAWKRTILLASRYASLRAGSQASRDKLHALAVLIEGLLQRAVQLSRQ